MAKSSNFLAGLAAGALVGVAVGLLVAPKPGKEARLIAGARADEALRKAREYLDALREALSDARKEEAARLPPDPGENHRG